MKYTFSEVQKFSQWWLWGLLLGLFSILLYQSLVNLDYFSLTNFNVFDERNPLIPLLIMLILISLFYMISLTTKIDDSGIYMRFFPFVTKRILWPEIDALKVLNYGFVGGWGIRIGTKYGTVYNIRGKEGLSIRLKNGKKLLIGTQKPIELKEFVDSYKIKITN